MRLRVMKNKAFILLLISSLWRVQASEMNGREPAFDIASSNILPSIAPPRLGSVALIKSLAQLERRRYSLFNQGIVVETLDGTKVLAELNSDLPFNPASVIKIATSFMALQQLGPDYRFQTVLYGGSQVDQARRTLYGDLFLVSDGNPVFRPADAQNLCRLLLRRELRRVEGNLVVVGPFSLNASLSTQQSAEQMRRYLNRSGIRITGKSRILASGSIDVESKVHFLTHTSERLRQILWTQNAYSVNEIADRLGNLLGGAESVRQFLMDAIRLEPHEVYITRPSGLEYNRMTARATVKMLRELYYWLASRQMKMQDIMPVAGIDEGTLFGRFRDPICRGGILGKTGTNPSKDGGVSSLAGIAYTRNHGPLLYAIFNTHGSVRTYRRWQDNFLQNLVEESGGVGEYLNPHEEMVNIYSSSPWVPSEYFANLNEGPLVIKQVVLKRAKFQSRKVAKHRRYSSRRART